MTIFAGLDVSDKATHVCVVDGEGVFGAAGNDTSIRKRDGPMLAYTYDALNRMTVKTSSHWPLPHLAAGEASAA